MPLAASVGDTWTISGRVEVLEGFLSELPEGTAEVSSTFTIEGIGTSTYQIGSQGGEAIERPTIQIKATSVSRDKDVNIPLGRRFPYLRVRVGCLCPWETSALL